MEKLIWPTVSTFAGNLNKIFQDERGEGEIDFLVTPSPPRAFEVKKSYQGGLSLRN